MLHDAGRQQGRQARCAGPPGARARARACMQPGPRTMLGSPVDAAGCPGVDAARAGAAALFGNGGSKLHVTAFTLAGLLHTLAAGPSQQASQQASRPQAHLKQAWCGPPSCRPSCTRPPSTLPPRWACAECVLWGANVLEGREQCRALEHCALGCMRRHAAPRHAPTLLLPPPGAGAGACQGGN